MKNTDLGISGIAAACVLLAEPIQASLVMNGDFQTGTATPLRRDSDLAATPGPVTLLSRPTLILLRG